MTKVKQTWHAKWFAREENGNSSSEEEVGVTLDKEKAPPMRVPATRIRVEFSRRSAQPRWDQHCVHHTSRILCTNRRHGGVDARC
jgi:hypothetical protein